MLDGVLDFLPIGVAIVCYLFAGHQSWWRMLLQDPDPSNCGLVADIRNNSLPFYVYSVFILFYPVIFLIAWLMNKSTKPSFS